MPAFDAQRRQNEKKKLGGFNPNREKKPRAWSHQDELQALRGKTIIYCVLDEGIQSGTLLEADQFTIKVKKQGFKSSIVVFKSSLTYFSEAA